MSNEKTINGAVKLPQKAGTAARPKGRSMKAIIRLFVDDQREPEWFGLSGWTVARTSAEAIAVLEQGHVVECSLDHDLGGDDTGYKVVCWMEAHGVWPKDGTRCHSANPVGKSRIDGVIRKANNQLCVKANALSFDTTTGGTNA